ncbi:MAG: pyruvate kinase [Elusimicrobia bacterium GWA2_69_24]|nr:MAG: pyruvate kinase [Elusimicrobia bacterium GWA2_69_24]HBL15230.1 pyruvate kinase [Elusimicrobiota bacterium]
MKTGIICTIGPASSGAGVLRRLIAAGMTVARINFSHGSSAEHRRRVAAVRAAARAAGRKVLIMGDLQGPKIRIGTFRSGPVVLKEGAVFTVRAAPVPGTRSIVSTDYADLHRFTARGDRVYFDDGKLELRVERVAGRDIRCRVVLGGPLSDRKGLTVLDRSFPMPGVTEEDRRDLELGAALGLDWFAHSFVRRPEHVREVRERLRGLGVKRPFVIAKIEDGEGFRNLGGILRASDGVMVARGDLGVSVRGALVPLLQRDIIRRCSRAGKTDIVATQMLETMTQNPFPTRAEVNDVATAVLQGADYVMLSGETAVGKYPVRAVATMAEIAAAAEAGLP